jgi:hypothetical protein
MRLYRPAILLHGALAVAAFVIALASSAGWEGMAPSAPADHVADSKAALEHAQAVYRTKGYAEAEDALRCAGFGDLAAARVNRPALAGHDQEVIPHPAVRHAAGELARHGTSAGLCAHLQQAAVHRWYREQFMP